jgi:hypothetical protein
MALVALPKVQVDPDFGMQSTRTPNALDIRCPGSSDSAMEISFEVGTKQGKEIWSCERHLGY